MVRVLRVNIPVNLPNFTQLASFLHHPLPYVAEALQLQPAYCATNRGKKLCYGKKSALTLTCKTCRLSLNSTNMGKSLCHPPKFVIPFCKAKLPHTQREMEDKISLYFSRGAKEVWLCDPDGNLTFHIPADVVPQSMLFPLFPQRLET